MGDCQARFRERLEVQFLRPTRQYFLGLEAFTYEQVMTPSLLVSIRKRIDLDVFESLTDDLIRKGLKLKTGVNPDDVNTEVKDEDEDDVCDTRPHEGGYDDEQRQAGQGHGDIDHPHEDLVGKAAFVGCEYADGPPTKPGNRGHDKTYEEAHPRSVTDLGPDVHTELIGAEDVFGPRPLQ